MVESSQNKEAKLMRVLVGFANPTQMSEDPIDNISENLENECKYLARE